jgi:hypothetical protein
MEAQDLGGGMGNMWWKPLVVTRGISSLPLDLFPVFFLLLLLRSLLKIVALVGTSDKIAMLTRLAQFFSGSQVSRNVDDELDDQRRELERVQQDMANVRRQLREGQNAVDTLREKEEMLRSDVEKLLMEIHDPILNRQHDAEITGDSETRWEEIPFTLANPSAVFKRIIVETFASHSGSSSDDDECDEASTVKEQPRRRKKRLDFVTLAEHSDVDEMRHSSSSESEHDERATASTTAVTIHPAGKQEPRASTPLQPKRRTVVHLQDLREDDFVSPLEYRRWMAYATRLEQEKLLRAYFEGKILNDLRERREVVEGKLFERHCDLIHLQAFEEHAMRQLDAYTMRGAPHAGNPQAAAPSIVVHEDAPVVTMEERIN